MGPWKTKWSCMCSLFKLRFPLLASGILSDGSALFLSERIHQCQSMQARVALSDGTRYVGQFLMGEYCGKGKLKFNFGRGFAHGDFDYGRMHGVLTREYMNGNIYEGSFR
jgi:hypothetical protein